MTSGVDIVSPAPELPVAVRYADGRVAEHLEVAQLEDVDAEALWSATVAYGFEMERKIAARLAEIETHQARMWMPPLFAEVA